MRRIHPVIFVLLLSGIFLGLIPGKAQAQNYVFGTATYSAPVVATAISPPFGNLPIISADFNGDGIPDLAVLGTATSQSQILSIYLGKPGGTFAPRVDYATQANGFTVGDFNGDGKLDIVTVSRQDSNVAAILLGNGDGTFQPSTPLNQTIAYGYSTAASADFNGDGKQDLLFLSPSFGSGATMLILLGNGDGSFQTPVSYQVPVGPYLAIGDFNGDGKPDIAVSGPYYFDPAHSAV